MMPCAVAITSRPSRSASRAIAAAREILADRHAPAEQMRRVERLQHDIGVGDGGLVVAAAVADRARIGAGAARPDLEQPAGIDIGDRAAAGADGVDVEHRRLDRIAVHDRLAGELGLRRSAAAPRRCEVPPMSKVMRLAKPAMRADACAATTPVLGPESTVRTGSRAAASKPITPPFDCVRCGVAGQPSSFRRSAEPADVALHDRAEIGVHHRGRDALVLAEFRRHLVRGADEGLGKLLCEDARGASPRARGARSRRGSRRRPP